MRRLQTHKRPRIGASRRTKRHLIKQDSLLLHRSARATVTGSPSLWRC